MINVHAFGLMIDVLYIYRGMNIEIYDIKVKIQYMYITLTIFHLFWPHVILKLI